MLVTETFHGYIETTQDVLLIFEGCRRGLLPRICRRLQEKERKMVQSGSVFVFDERESGIKRWTDGLVWSPSRIMGNFLIYRELDKRTTGNGKRMSISGASDSRQRSYSADHGSSSTVAAAGGVMSVDRNRERQLVGSLSDSYKFRKDGLIKKTMSIVVNGVSQHLISYYHPQDVLQNRLRTPSSVPELASLEISPELLVKQNFRIPPMVEPTFDQADALGGAGGPMSPTDPLSAYGDRRSHPLRSMSLGSLRTPDHFHGNMIPRSDINSPNMMYNYGNHHHHHHQQQSHRMEVEESHKQQSPPIPSYASSQQPVMYNGSVPPYQQPTMPSPSSMSSSPGTPMMSPVRPTFQQHHQPQQQQQQSHHSQPPPHQRHYSVSSASSGSLSSLSRMDPRSYEMMRPPQAPPTTTSTSTIHSPQPQSASTSSFGQVHPHMVQENNMGGFYNNNGTARMNDQQQHQDPESSHSDHTKSNANIGQLLNPVHPLHNGNHGNGNPSSTSSSIQPDSPHPTQQQQPMLVNPNPSYAAYPMNAAAASSSVSSSSSTTTPSSSVVPVHYDSKHTNEDTKMVHPHHTMCNAQAAAENGTTGSGSGGGGGSGPSEYRYQEALTNTYSMMNYAPSPYQNGVLNPFTNDDTAGHDLSGTLMLK